MIGQTISHYKITSKLGEGGMGEVFLATDLNLDRPVAMKFLPAALQSDPEARERLIREAKAASKLHHPNILTVHAVEQHEGRDFIVMEYVDGRPLTESSNIQPRPISEIIGLAISVAEGLQKAHSVGITHRDIKPANILIDADGHPRILDFGLAKVQGADKLTKTGSTLGTVAYMSPEQASGKDVDGRSDIFSFGVVLYELVTGRTPFQGVHEAAITYAIINETPEPMSRFKADVPGELERIVAKSLAKSVRERYQSIADMLADLRALRRVLEESRSATQQAAISAIKPRRYAMYVVVGTIFTAAALAFFVLRPFKVEVSSEQKASASENSLAVLCFDNLVDADDKDKTAQMITSLLITGLSESEHLQVTSRQRLYEIMSQLGIGQEKSVDRSTASQIAQKAGVRWMVTGDIVQLTPRIVLAAEVSEIGSGKLVTTEKIQGDPGGDLFTAVDRLGNLIRDDMSARGLLKKDNVRPVADVTTHSQDAYRAYVEGLDLWLRYYGDDAAVKFKEAIKYDSTFAMAYYRLAVGPISADRPQKRKWLAAAKRHSARATWKEQHYIRAASFTVEDDLESALLEYEKIVARYPDEKDALLTLGEGYYAQGDTQGAISRLERVVEIDPTYAPAYNGLAYMYDRIGNFEKSIAAINQYVALSPDDANPYDTRGDLYAYNGKLEEALDSYRRANQLKKDFSVEKIGAMYLFKRDYPRAESTFQAIAASDERGPRSSGRTFLAYIPAYQGRFAEAIRVLESGMTADKMEGFEDAIMWKLAAIADMFEAQGKYDSALAYMHAGEALVPRDPGELQTDVGWEIRLLCKLGEKSKAEELAKELLAAIQKKDTTKMYFYWRVSATIAEADGQWNDMISWIERIPPAVIDADDRYSLGRACLETGHLDRAVAALEKSASRYDMARLLYADRTVKVHYLLGRAYEQSGWREKAAERYREFLEIWKSADPGIPEVDDAKARLAKLTS